VNKPKYAAPSTMKDTISKIQLSLTVHFFIHVLTHHNGMAHLNINVLVKVLICQSESDNPSVIPSKLADTVKSFIYKNCHNKYNEET
jgi:hypothetical protein